MSLSLEELANDLEFIAGSTGDKNSELRALEQDQNRAKENYARRLKEIEAEGAKAGAFNPVLSDDTQGPTDTENNVGPAVATEQTSYDKWLKEITSTDASNFDLTQLAGLGSLEDEAGKTMSPTPVEERVDYLVQKLKNIDDKELEWNRMKTDGDGSQLGGTLGLPSSVPLEEAQINLDDEDAAVETLRLRLEERKKSGFFNIGSTKARRLRAQESNSTGQAAVGDATLDSGRPGSTSPKDYFGQHRHEKDVMSVAFASELLHIKSPHGQHGTEMVWDDGRPNPTAETATATPPHTYENAGGELKAILKVRRRKSETGRNAVTTSEDVRRKPGASSVGESGTAPAFAAPTIAPPALAPPSAPVPPIPSPSAESSIERRENGPSIDSEQSDEMERLLQRAKIHVDGTGDPLVSGNVTSNVALPTAAFASSVAPKFSPSSTNSPLSPIAMTGGEGGRNDFAVQSSIHLPSPGPIKTAPAVSSTPNSTIVDNAIAQLANRARFQQTVVTTKDPPNEDAGAVVDAGGAESLYMDDDEDDSYIELMREKEWLKEQIRSMETKKKYKYSPKSYRAKRAKAGGGGEDHVTTDAGGQSAASSGLDFSSAYDDSYVDSLGKSSPSNSVENSEAVKMYDTLLVDNFKREQRAGEEENSEPTDEDLKISQVMKLFDDSYDHPTKPSILMSPPRSSSVPKVDESKASMASEENEVAGANETALNGEAKDSDETDGKGRDMLTERIKDRPQEHRKYRRRQSRDDVSLSDRSYTSSSSYTSFSSDSSSSDSGSSFSSGGGKRKRSGKRYKKHRFKKREKRKKRNKRARKRRHHHRRRHHHSRRLSSDENEEDSPSPTRDAVPAGMEATSDGSPRPTPTPMPSFDDFLKAATEPATALENPAQAISMQAVFNPPEENGGNENSANATEPLDNSVLQSYRAQAIELERQRAERKKAEMAMNISKLKSKLILKQQQKAKRQNAARAIQKWWKPVVINIRRAQELLESQNSVPPDFARAPGPEVHGPSDATNNDQHEHGSVIEEENSFVGSVGHDAETVSEEPFAPRAMPGSETLRFQTEDGVDRTMDAFPPSINEPFPGHIADGVAGTNVRSQHRQLSVYSSVVNIQTRLAALLHGYRVRRLMKVPRVQTLINQIKDSQRMVDDMVAESTGGGSVQSISADPLCRSLMKQLKTQKTQLYTQFLFNPQFDGVGAILGYELSKAREAREDHVSRGATSPRSSPSTARQPNPNKGNKGGQDSNKRGQEYLDRMKRYNERLKRGYRSVPSSAPKPASRNEYDALDEEADQEVLIETTSLPKGKPRAGPRADPMAKWLETSFNAPALIRMDQGVRSVAIQVVRASNLAVASHIYKERAEARDPYAVVTLVASARHGGSSVWRSESYQTRSVKNTLDPVFKESFVFGLPQFSDLVDINLPIDATFVEVELHDKDRFNKNTFLGYARVPLGRLFQEENSANNNINLSQSEQTVALQKRNQRDLVRGNVQLRIKLIDIPSDTARSRNHNDSRRKPTDSVSSNNPLRKKYQSIKSKVSSRRGKDSRGEKPFLPRKVREVFNTANDDMGQTYGSGSKNRLGAQPGDRNTREMKKKKIVSYKLDWSHVKSKTDSYLKRQPKPPAARVKEDYGMRARQGPAEYERGFASPNVNPAGPAGDVPSIRVRRSNSSPTSDSRPEYDPVNSLGKSIELYQFGPSSPQLRAKRTRLGAKELGSLLDHLAENDKRLLSLESAQESSSLTKIPRIDHREFFAYDEQTYESESLRLNDEYAMLGGAGVSPTSPY
jgi:hypothetical protein